MPSTPIQHPTNGSNFFGLVEEKSVRGYVIPGAEIIRVGSPIYCEFNAMKGVRVTVVRGVVGLAILEHKAHRDDSHYSIITAYSQKNPYGTRVGSVANCIPPGA